MLTHFESIVGLLSICFGLLSAILGLVWKAARKWSDLIDRLDNVVEKVEVHMKTSALDKAEMERRFKKLERRKRNAVQSRRERGKL